LGKGRAMTGGARKGEERDLGGRGREGRLGRPWAQSGGAGRARWAAAKPAHDARGGERWRAGWAKKGRRGRREKREDFPFFISIFYMNAFTLSNNQKNAWFDMM
jgi:hypothetical protein